MTERLRRIHALLQAGNVPCALSSIPGIGTVLLAGTPNEGPWDVVAHETAGTVRIQHAGRTAQVPASAADMAIANAIKIRVVQSWADQGDPEAKALIARLNNSSPEQSARQPHAQPAMTMQFMNPLQFAADMFDAVNRLGWDMLGARGPMHATYSLPSPWGTIQGTYFRR